MAAAMAVMTAMVVMTVMAVMALMETMAIGGRWCGCGKLRRPCRQRSVPGADCHRTSVVPNRPVNFPTAPMSAHPASTRQMST
jgi:hypothetical protein